MSTKSHSDGNERIKRLYVHHLRHKLGLGDVAVDQFSTAIHRFESYTEFTDFERFHREQGARVQAAPAARVSCPCWSCSRTRRE
jgi:hypothetical protein